MINVVESNYRNYENSDDCVKRIYKKIHTNQTYDYVLKTKKEVFPLRKAKLNYKKITEIISNIKDESDPDFENGSQLYHNIQAGEACKILFPDEDWMHLVGFIHDFGKILMSDEVYGMPDWSVVGDINPLGCPYSTSIVFYDYLKQNPDFLNENFLKTEGIYKEKCGFSNMEFSFSHDLYMYEFLKQNEASIPEEGLYVIRFHSFYPWHKYQQYSLFADELDLKMLKRLQEFMKADLYTKDKANIKILLIF